MERRFESGQGFYQQSGFNQRGSSRHHSHQPENWRERNSETSTHTNNLPTRQNYTHHPQSQQNGHCVVRQYNGQPQNGFNRRSETSSSSNYLPPHQRNKSNVISKYAYKIDPNAVFAGREVEGVRLLTDYKQVRNIQKRIAEYSNGGSPDYYSAMSSVDISKEHFKQMEATPYFVAPKPDGYRCLLYVKDTGEIFLQARSVHIFQMDAKYASDLFGSKSCITTDTLIDTTFQSIDPDTDSQESSKTTDIESSDPEARTRTIHAFYIMDAMRINGQDVTHLNVDQRISLAKEKIMKPMWETLKPMKLYEQKEKFGVYIVDYVRLDEAEVLLNPEFQDSLDYPLQFLHFIPENQPYKSGTCSNAFLWKGGSGQAVFFFRLRIPDNSTSTGEKSSDEGELLALQNSVETPYAKIALTDEIRHWNGHIIQCTYKEGKWIYCSISAAHRCYPNGQKTIESKLESAKHPVMMQDLRNFFRKHARQAPFTDNC